MHYQFSTVIDAAAIETHGLCDGIPLRVHKSQDLEDAGAIEAQRDWMRHKPSSSYQKGSLGPDYNFLSVAFPETFPERLKILAYLNEYVFLHDDVVESTSKIEGDRLNDGAMDICQHGSNGAHLHTKTVSESMMLAISRRIMSIDPDSGAQALNLWAEWFKEGAGRNNHRRYDNLDTYLTYRVLDVGEKYLTGIEIFALGLKLQESELETLSSLCRPAWVALGLTNDFYSYEKEIEAAKNLGRAHVCNAVSVLMLEHGISELDAKGLCIHEARRNVGRFVRTVSTTLARADVSSNIRTFVEAVQYILSGNIIWTLGAPRYNARAAYNARQLEWLAHGTSARSLLAE